MNAYASLAANENRADLPMSVVTRAALALPPFQQIELMRLLAGEFSNSYGVDEIDRGIDMILIDHRDAAQAPTLVGYGPLEIGGAA